MHSNSFCMIYLTISSIFLAFLQVFTFQKKKKVSLQKFFMDFGLLTEGYKKFLNFPYHKNKGKTFFFLQFHVL